VSLPKFILHRFSFAFHHQLSMNITLTLGDKGTPKFFSCALTNASPNEWPMTTGNDWFGELFFLLQVTSVHFTRNITDCDWIGYYASVHGHSFKILVVLEGWLVSLTSFGFCLILPTAFRSSTSYRYQELSYTYNHRGYLKVR